MAKTQGQIVEAVQIKLEDTGEINYDLRMIRLWINEATNDIARRSECLMAEETTPVVAGTQAYDAPDNVIRIHRVAFTPTGQTSEYDLQFMEYKNMSSISWTGLRRDNGTPAVFYPWGTPPNLQINLYPIPGVAGTLKYSYFRTATELSVVVDTEMAVAVDLPTGWEDLIVDYVVSEALMIDRDPRADLYKTRYNDRLAAMAEAASSFVDQTGSIVQGASYVPSWLFNPDGEWY